MSIKIRIAQIEDVEDILRIYAPYVLNTNITFEYNVPTLDEMKARMQKTLETYPYLVALDDERIIGYAYASPFHSRAAYQWGSELSIYLDQHYHGQSIGKKLYSVLLALLKCMNVQNVYACITHPNEKSEKFHAFFDFQMVGCFHRAGYKMGNWHDVIWMEKAIDHQQHVEALIPFSQLTHEQIESCLALCYDK